MLVGGPPWSTNQQNQPSSLTTELLTETGSIESFGLKYPGEEACLIDEGETFLLTGGTVRGSSVAARYNKDGWIEDLNFMKIPRGGHACLQYSAWQRWK